MVFIPVQDDNPLRSIRVPWVTLALIAINLAVFIAETLGSPDFRVAASFAIVPKELYQVGFLGGAANGPNDALAVPERFTLLTYMFLHGDILHLTTNMLFLWVFGDNVEDALGHARFLAFYLLCGLAAGLAHAVMRSDSTIPLIGASGAVAGIIAAYLILYPTIRVWVLAFRFIPIRVPVWAALGSWLISQVMMVVVPQFSDTAWWAHLGGVLAGALLVVVLRRPGVVLFDRTGHGRNDPQKPSATPD
jgi:membrane associated rhomboid family serine protease